MAQLQPTYVCSQGASWTNGLDIGISMAQGYTWLSMLLTRWASVYPFRAFAALVFQDELSMISQVVDTQRIQGFPLPYSRCVLTTLANKNLLAAPSVLVARSWGRWELLRPQPRHATAPALGSP